MKLADFRAITIASRAFLPSFYFDGQQCQWANAGLLAYWWRKIDAGWYALSREPSRPQDDPCRVSLMEGRLKVRGLEPVSRIKKPRLSLLRRLAGDLLLYSSRRCLLQGEQRIFEAKIHRTTEGTKGISQFLKAKEPVEKDFNRVTRQKKWIVFSGRHH